MKYSKIIILALVISAFLGACQEQKEHTAAAVRDRDSVSMMISYGVNTLISDSGVIKYRIVTERWEVNTVRNPSRWIFEKGLFFEQFDEKFHVQSYIQCDSLLLRPETSVGTTQPCKCTHQRRCKIYKSTTILGRDQTRAVLQRIL